MQKSFWSNWFKPVTGNSRRWTLEELRELYEVLLRNGVVTEHNRAVVVETIRTIAEYILWGDQNEPRIFDFFLENNILTYLHKILLQPSNRSGEVAKQVLQTLSIIIQNVRSETGIFFLFSNNHINNIVDLDFDFSDEEVLGYYISFLKTISLKLNAGTVHFFLNSSSGGRGFPLYTRAIRLAHNREGMVRAAVRTLTLNVYSVADPDIQRFVTSPPAANYFTEVVQYLAEQVQLLDRHLSAAEAGGSQALAALDSQLAETEDVLSYVSDLLSLGVPRISQLLAKALWQWVVRPLLLRPLMEPRAAAAPCAPLTPTASLNTTTSSRGVTPTASGLGSPARAGHFRHFSWGSGSWTPDAAAKQSRQMCIRPISAVLVLERLFLLVSYQPLLQQLLLALACGASAAKSSSNSSSSSSGDGNHPLADAADASGGSSSDSGTSCRVGVLGMLSGGQPFPALLVLRLLVAIVNSKHLPAALLMALSIPPRQQQHAVEGSSSLEDLVQILLQQLQAASGTADRLQQKLANGVSSAAGSAAAAGDGSQPVGLQVDLPLLLTEQYMQVHWEDDEAAAAGGSSDGGSEGQSSSSINCMQLLDQWVVASQQQVLSPAAALAQPDYSTFNSFGDQLLSCLMPLLRMPGLPPMGLWLLGWLLHQLLPASSIIGAAAGSSSPGGGGGGAGQHRVHSTLRYMPENSSEPGSRGISSSNSSDDGGGSSCLQHQRGSSADGAELQQTDSNHDSTGFESGACGPPVSTKRTTSVQSALGLEPRASLLRPDQQQVLQQALDAAHAGFAQQLGSMWCEAVFPLLALEWPAARDMLLRPVLRSGSCALLSGTAVWPVLQAVQQQQQQSQQGRQQQQQQQQASWLEGQSASAVAALDCYAAVQRVVALTQIQELLRVGCIASSPPVATVSEADLKQVDIQEGYQVDLAPGSALPCVVSFAPGQERRVYFAVAGLSRQQLAAMQGAAPGSPGLMQAAVSGAISPSSHSGGAGSSHASLLRSLPVAVLADPSPNRPQAGVVLSVAPLLGAHPYTDPQVGKWLHVHVRPSVRGLLRIIKTASAKKGGLLAAMRQLADGHWVLAFSAAEKAALAVTVVQQHAAQLQALYGEALAPLSQQPPQGEKQLEMQEQQHTHQAVGMQLEQQHTAIMPPQQPQRLTLQPEQPSQQHHQQQQQESQPPKQPLEQQQQQQDASGPAHVVQEACSGVEAASTRSGAKGGQSMLQRLTDDIAHASLTDDKE